MSVEPVVLGFGLLCLLLGLGLYIYIVAGRRLYYFQSANLIAWLLVALFPVLVIFSLFPDSSMSIGLKGVSAGGAIAAFVFIWRFGTKSGLAAVDEDRHQGEILDRDRQIESLTKQLDAGRARASPAPLPDTKIYRYKCKDLGGRELGLITGNLSKISFVDVWVNSENTNMQMASFFDRSVSGFIRWAGARKDPYGNVIDDVIGKAVAERLEGHVSVSPGTVFLTTSGDLLQTHNVKCVLHAAAVSGQAGQGYKQIQDVGRCMENGLQAMEEEKRVHGAILRSVVFPLLGTGQGRGEVNTTVRTLLAAAIDYLRSHRQASVRAIYFLVFTDTDLIVCKDVFGHYPDLIFNGVRSPW